MSTQLVLKADHVTQGFHHALDADGRPQVHTTPDVADSFIDAINDAHELRLAAAEWRAALFRYILHITAAPGTVPVLALLKDHGIDVFGTQSDTAPHPRNGDAR